MAQCRALSALESQFACLCETHAAHSGADACHMLPSGLRLRAAAVDSMMKLQAAGGLEAASHAMSGVVSTIDPKTQADRVGATASRSPRFNVRRCLSHMPPGFIMMR